jgi:hypothetical protein
MESEIAALEPGGLSWRDGDDTLTDEIADLSDAVTRMRADVAEIRGFLARRGAVLARLGSEPVGA